MVVCASSAQFWHTYSITSGGELQASLATHAGDAELPGGVTPAVEHAIGTWLCCVAAAVWILWMTHVTPRPPPASLPDCEAIARSRLQRPSGDSPPCSATCAVPTAAIAMLQWVHHTCSPGAFPWAFVAARTAGCGAPHAWQPHLVAAWQLLTAGLGTVHSCPHASPSPCLVFTMPGRASPNGVADVTAGDIAAGACAAASAGAGSGAGAGAVVGTGAGSCSTDGPDDWACTRTALRCAIGLRGFGESDWHTLAHHACLSPCHGRPPAPTCVHGWVHRLHGAGVGPSSGCSVASKGSAACVGTSGVHQLQARAGNVSVPSSTAVGLAMARLGGHSPEALASASHLLRGGVGVLHSAFCCGCEPFSVPCGDTSGAGHGGELGGVASDAEEGDGVAVAGDLTVVEGDGVAVEGDNADVEGDGAALEGDGAAATVAGSDNGSSGGDSDSDMGNTGPAVGSFVGVCLAQAWGTSAGVRMVDSQTAADVVACVLRAHRLCMPVGDASRDAGDDGVQRLLLSLHPARWLTTELATINQTVMRLLLEHFISHPTSFNVEAFQGNASTAPTATAGVADLALTCWATHAAASLHRPDVVQARTTAATAPDDFVALRALWRRRLAAQARVTAAQDDVLACALWLPHLVGDEALATAGQHSDAASQPAAGLEACLRDAASPVLCSQCSTCAPTDADTPSCDEADSHAGSSESASPAAAACPPPPATPMDCDGVCAPSLPNQATQAPQGDPGDGVAAEGVQAVPLSDAPLWERHREYYDKAGVDAWGDEGDVPFNITNNAFIAARYVDMILALLPVPTPQYVSKPTRPAPVVHVLELGSGHVRGRGPSLWERTVS